MTIENKQFVEVVSVPVFNNDGSPQTNSNIKSFSSQPGKQWFEIVFDDNEQEFVSIDSFESYINPIQSTDYVGIEKIDPRLADRKWRLNNLYKVVNEDGDLVPFRLRVAQEYLLDNMHHRNIILKARQLGFTTFICIFLLDYALFNRNKNVGILAQTQPDASVIFRKVKTAWENFPQEIKDFFHLDATGDSKVEYEFTNGSFMRVSTSLRSGTYQAVLVTEFGKVCARFPERAEEIKTGTFPAVPKKGILFVESTAEGEEGHFYDMCQDAMEEKRTGMPLTTKQFKFFFFPWFENPENFIPGNISRPKNIDDYLDKVERVLKIKLQEEQRNWYYLEEKIQKTKMQQEHPSTPEEAFLVSGNKMFDPVVVDAQREFYMRNPIEVQGDFRIYSYYNKNHTYGLGADVSLGVKRDSSTIVVIDFTFGEVVLTYRSRDIDPVNFAYDIKKAALMYGGCIAAPEANNVGLTTCVTLNQIYDNIYMQNREGLLEEKPTQKLGWLSTAGSKPRMMYEFSDAMADNEIKIPDEGILLEARKFNKEDSLVVTTNENTTRHFDLLIGAAICWQVRHLASRGRVDPVQEAEVVARRERRTRGNNNYR